jgi:hypothetical protein
MASEKCDLISHTDITYFEVFVISVTRNGFRHAAYWAAESLGEITRILVDSKTESLTIRSSLFALGKLGMVAAEKEFDGTAAMVVHASLLQIGTTLTGGSIPNKKRIVSHSSRLLGTIRDFHRKSRYKIHTLNQTRRSRTL